MAGAPTDEPPPASTPARSPGPHPAAVLLAFAAGIAGAVVFARGSFLAGGALLAASVLALRRPASLWGAAEPPEPSRGARRLLLCGVLALAAFYRAYRMTPPGLWGDDAINGLLAFDVIDGKITSPFQLVAHSASQFHALTNYSIAAAFWAFGPSLAALRLPGVLLNLLCVPLVYATFAPLFRARVALIAALFFAVSPMQLSHGKMLLQSVHGEFLHLLAMCLLVRGYRGARPWLVAVAGVPLGLSLCTYHAYKLGVPVAVVAALVLLWERPDDRRRLARWSTAGLVALVLAAAPGWLAYAARPSALTARIGGTSVLNLVHEQGSLWPLWDSLWRTLAVFHYQQGPVLYHWFGIGTEPALDPIAGMLVVHGLLQSVRRWREPRHLLLLAWFVIGIVPGVLSSEAPRGYRIFLAAPPVLVWAALPLERLLAWGVQVPRRRRAYAAIAGASLLAVSVYDFNHYFVRVYTHRDYLWMQATRMVDMARTLRAYGPEWKGYLLASNFDAGHESLRFLQRLWGLELRTVASLTEVMPQRLDENALLIFDPTAAPMVEPVKQFYPGATEQVHRQPAPRTWLLDPWLPLGHREEGRTMAVYLPLARDAAAHARGLQAIYLDGDGLPVASQILQRAALPAHGAPPPPPARRAIVTGALYAPADGTYELALDGTAAARVVIDGRPLPGPERHPARVELVQGLHDFAAAVGLAGGGFELRWLPPNGGGSPRPIPPAFLLRRGAGGWLAEYANDRRTTRRLEPMPWYQLYAPTFDGRYRVRWRGRLRVPEDGRALHVRVRGKLTLLVDGEPLEQGATVAAGEHDIDILIEDVEGAQLLDILWRTASGHTTHPPLDAFAPPRAVEAGAGGLLTRAP